MSEYGIVIPFVTVKTKGGPHEDHSYVCGYTMGVLDATLPHANSYTLYVHPSNLPQADLIAMRHGFSLESEPWVDSPDDWALLTFSRLGADG